MWATIMSFLSTGGAKIMTVLSPILKPIGAMLQKALDKSYLLVIAYMAKRQGKKDARAESVEEVLKHVDETKKARNSAELRKIVEDKYSR